jgi:hypothetical protein
MLRFRLVLLLVVNLHLFMEITNAQHTFNLSVGKTKGYGIGDCGILGPWVQYGTLRQVEIG